MFTIFTTEKKLVELYSTIGNDWQQIVFNHARFQISNSSVSDFKFKNRMLSDLRRGQRLCYKPAFVDSINSNRASVLSNPSAVYILDITPQDAKEIRDTYGVLCYSNEEEFSNPLIHKGWDIDTADSRFDKRWSTVLSNLDVPSNFILITDRYLLSSERNKYDATLNETIADTYNNIYEILNAVLPQELGNNVYQVIIVCDASTITDKDENNKFLDFAKVVERIMKVKKKLKRPYDYSIEVISIDSNNSSFKETHDRQICSNYFWVNASHKLKAYKDGVSLCNQTINFRYLFSEGVAHNSRSSTPAFSRDRTIETIKSAVTKPAGSERYFFNGIEEPITIKNRVLL